MPHLEPSAAKRLHFMSNKDYRNPILQQTQIYDGWPFVLRVASIGTANDRRARRTNQITSRYTLKYTRIISDVRALQAARRSLPFTLLCEPLLLALALLLEALRGPSLKARPEFARAELRLGLLDDAHLSLWLVRVLLRYLRDPPI